MGHTPLHKLTPIIVQAQQEVRIGAFYHHWRTPDQQYKVLDIALLEANEQPAVVYQSLNDENPVTWIRPLHGIDGWLTPVMHNGIETARFQLVDTSR